LRGANHLGMLIRNNQIGTAAYDKIASIMNRKPRNIFNNNKLNLGDMPFTMLYDFKFKKEKNQY